MKILVIEDSATARNALSQHLRSLNMEPLTASDGFSGIEMVSEHRPDLVLLDVVLPRMDGFDVARRIREREGPGDWTPIIFLTMRTGDEDLEKGIAAGGDDYLTKPVSPVVLGAKLRAMQRIMEMRQALLATTRALDAANQELRRLSAVDGLTGIANRRHFDESLSREWRRAARARRPLTVILWDIDFFKQYNDVYGHQSGDTCLKAVANALAAEARRPGDRVTRFGGEEFAIILPDTDARGAAYIAERMRIAVVGLAIPHSGSTVARIVTASGGVASLVPQAEGGESELVHWADAALYEAKRAGRNRVVTYGLGGDPREN
jgi:diguanylate cyclase (GGDEF)-like protein